MKQARIITLTVAGFAGGIAIYMMMNLKPKAAPMQPIDETRSVKTTKVLVAKKDIGLGETVGMDSFRWQEWPEGALSPSFVVEGRKLSLKDFDKRIARAPLLIGEPATENKLIKFGEAGGVMSAILPPGMRAISTKIREETAAGRLILPNDYVDVILIQRKRGKGGGGGEEFVSDTLFRNVRILAIGQNIETKEGKKVADGNTATPLPTPWASSASHFGLSPTSMVKNPAPLRAPGPAIPSEYCVTALSRVLMA
jgi:pilus assembly protein CpaB